MKIAIITSVSGKSSKTLAQELVSRSHGLIKKADVFYPYKDDERRNFLDYDVVFGYGCSATTQHKKRLNSAGATKKCVDKRETFKAWETYHEDIKYPNFVLSFDKIPKHWDTVVTRRDPKGRKAEDLEFTNQCDGEVPPRDGKLYTEHFDHTKEYRIMYFNGEIVGRYLKNDVDGEWYFDLQDKRGFELMDQHCIRAAKAIGIDYCGFDVVANTKRDFCILEANSGCHLTDEAETAIIQYFMDIAQQ